MFRGLYRGLVSPCPNCPAALGSTGRNLNGSRVWGCSPGRPVQPPDWTAGVWGCAQDAAAGVRFLQCSGQEEVLEARVGRVGTSLRAAAQQFQRSGVRV